MQPHEATGPRPYSTAPESVSGSASPVLDPSFLTAANTVKRAYEKTPQHDWSNSPFAWLRTLPSRSKGAAAESMIETWARSQGLTVKRSESSEFDRLIEGQRVEIKMSTLWQSGQFKFQQIRDQSYDLCLCLGIEPQRIRVWLLPKSVLHQHVIGHTGQHTGAAASDTFWLSFDAAAPPSWMKPYGDSLDEVRALLRAGAPSS